MSSPRPMATPAISSGGGGGGGAASSPAASGGAVLGDEAIWRRLREAGLDEETVKRRDKAALIAYISKLESEMHEYQHHLGLLIMEKKEWTSKYDQLKASAESSELMHKRERAAQSTALAEAKKREESLKNALGIEKECVLNIEKALHDMRAELAETKVTYESKLAEANQMMEDAQRKSEEAETKLIAARSLETDSIRTRDSALRSLQDVEAREDELRRRLAKENEISLQRKSLNDSQKILHEEEERLIEKQSLLNQREQYILERLENLSQFEKKLEEEKSIFEGERKALTDERSKLDLNIAALAIREEAIIQKESLLDKRERELLILQETIASKGQVEVQRLIDEQHSIMEKRMREFESEMEKKRSMWEDEMGAKKLSLDERENVLTERANSIQEREKAVEIQLTELAAKQQEVANKLNQIKEEEENLLSSKRAAEVELKNMQKEREDIVKFKADSEKTKNSLEGEKQEVLHAKEKLELTLAERNELLVLKTKLKEEIDSFRAQKIELLAEADKLQAEKERFEIEWELIDEKKEELQKEAERIAEEKTAISQFLKNEHDSIKQEKENLRNQFKNDLESLSREREEFMTNMQHEQANWLSKIQQEREEFKRDIEIQRKELQNSINQREAEIETSLRDKEEEFEQKKAKELQYVTSQKDMIKMQLEHIASQLEMLASERKQIALDREQRERELSEIKSSIELLNIQREKLQEQRELLHKDREEITKQIQILKELEDSNIESENRALSVVPTNELRVPIKMHTSNTNNNEEEIIEERNMAIKVKASEASPSASTPVFWVRRCAEVVFRRSSDKKAYFVADKDAQNRNLENIGKVREEKKEIQSSLAENVRSIQTVVTSLGRKRLKNSIPCNDADAELEPSRKLQKIGRQKRRIDGQGKNNCAPEGQQPWSSDENPKITNRTGPENVLKMSDDVLLLDSVFNGSLKTQKQLIDKGAFDSEGPSEEITTPAAKPIASNNHFKKQDVGDQDTDDEIDGEDEDEASVKDKLWNFLIT
ncbi:Protein CROWDED NUCLEI 4 [Ananas comosus]|uniref:Protein CROWDED NUCLEI 4 n=1 Tax=Ananas comosus TaxID=4615 RepID=A0A199WA42_ANACO|nr:Protein CROWDED NUCLEI 4 [Ananas comosus]